MELSEEAKEARRAAQRKYYAEHHAARRAYQKEWVKNNPERVRAYTARYWEKKAKEVGGGGIK